jgi:hypothetical protein
MASPQPSTTTNNNNNARPISTNTPTTTSPPIRKPSLLGPLTKDVGRVSTDAARAAREFIVHSASLIPKTFKLLVREGEIVLESTKKKKGKVYSVHAPADVVAKDRTVTLIPEGKRFVANSSKEAQEIVNAIRSSLVDGYLTAEDEDDQQDELPAAAAEQQQQQPTTPVFSTTSTTTTQQQQTEEDDNTTVATFGAGAGNLANTPEPLPHEMWSDPGTEGFKIRSRSYLTNRFKQPAQAQSLFRLIAIDLISTEKKVDYITNHPSNRVKLARQRGDNTFVWTINFQTPGPPYRSYLCYFIPSDARVIKILNNEPWEEEEGSNDLFGSSFPELLRSFFLAPDDSFRDSHFKIIPRICEGPWILKNLTPQNKPCLLAQKLKINYYRDAHGLEMDLDIGRGDLLADNLTRIGCNHAKSVVVDVAFLLESKLQSELPEFLCGIMRADHVDFSFLKNLDG